MELSRPPNKPGNWCVVDAQGKEEEDGEASLFSSGTSLFLIGNVPLIMRPMWVHSPLDPFAGAHSLYEMDKEREQIFDTK